MNKTQIRIMSWTRNPTHKRPRHWRLEFMLMFARSPGTGLKILIR